MKKLKVTRVKSVIHQPESVRKIVWALGLWKTQGSRIHKDNNCTRGMLNKIKHLVKYEFISE